MSTIISGTKSVTTAGTAEQLSTTSVFCKKLRVQAVAANSGAAFVGGSDVDSAEGATLDPTQATAEDFVEFENVDLASIWVDVATNGEDLSYVATIDHPAVTTVPQYAG